MIRGPRSIVPGMTRIVIDAEAIAALGDRLEEIAGYLEDRALEMSGPGAARHGFIDVSAGGALERTLGDYELSRGRLNDRLLALAELARAASWCYLEVEESNASSFARRSGAAPEVR